MLFNSRIPGKEVRKMSKKSKPGDGSHGKGTKGMKHEEFETMFQAPATPQKKDEKQTDEPVNNESES